MIDQIYGFVKINISEYKRYPLTEEDFWFSGYEGRDLGQDIWKDLVLLRKSIYDLNITYIVENTRTNGERVPSRVRRRMERIIVYRR